MDPLDNPYRPGAGTKPPALVGRDELIDQFGIAVRRTLRGVPGKSLMPIGLRGVGKTVLLNRFREIAEDEGCRVAFIEAPESGNFASLLTVNLRRILLRMQQEKASAKLLTALGVLKAFTLTFPDGTAIQLDVSALRGQGDSGVLSEDLSEVLTATGNAAAERGIGILLAVDEVQYLSGEELGALISAIHRTTQLNLPILLVGAGLPTLPGLAGNAKSYAERLFNFPRIDSLDRQTAAAAIQLPAQEHGAAFTPEALDLIVRESGGYPYFLQEWGSHVWNYATGSPVPLADVQSVKSAVIGQLDQNFFLVRFDRLTPMEKKYLRAMAELGPGPHRSGDIASCLGVNVESVAPRRSGLIVKGMIYSPAHGDTAFTVPLFDSYLKRAMPEFRRAAR